MHLSGIHYLLSFKITSLNNAKGNWAELSEIKCPWSVHLSQVLCNRMAYYWCLRLLNRGVRWMQVYFKIYVWRKVRDSIRCPLNGGCPLKGFSVQNQTAILEDQSSKFPTLRNKSLISCLPSTWNASNRPKRKAGSLLVHSKGKTLARKQEKRYNEF